MPLLAASDSLTAPTWLTAAFTGVLALGAIITAVFAIMAFLKQSQEVKDQADMLRIQSDQLGAQREQLGEQQKVNRKQIEVLELQARELRESLAEREREREQQHRGQASQVFISQNVSQQPATAYMDAIAGRETSPTVTAVVSNTSGLPIYGVQIIWHRGGAPHGEPDSFLSILPGSKAEASREFPAATDFERDGAAVRFRDAAGIAWVRRRDGALDEV